MQKKTRGIVLNALPYNDTYSIVCIYTEEFGRSSYLVARSRGRKSSVSKALFMPLSMLDMEVEHQNLRDLHRIKEAKLCYPLMQLYCDPVKNMLALFLSEVLYRVVRDTESDRRLFKFLEHSIHILECAEEGVANFHIVFLLHLLNYLGIYPNTESYKEGYLFDMRNGIFTDKAPLHRHYLNKEESIIFARLFKISYENMSLYHFSRKERVNIINLIITYYRLHLPEIAEIKSIAILQALFD